MPTADDLRKIAQLGGYTIQQLVNTKGQTFKKLKPDLAAMDDQAIIALIQENPSLMIRPILMSEKGLAKGFKEEEYEELLRSLS